MNVPFIPRIEGNTVADRQHYHQTRFCTYLPGFFDRKCDREAATTREGDSQLGKETATDEILNGHPA